MAYRKFSTQFWSDLFIEGLTVAQRYFYIFLLTNEKTKQCGIYEISIKQICDAAAMPQSEVLKMIDFFTQHGKIKYSETTREIAIKNWLRYNGSSSASVQQCINEELKLVKDRALIDYINSDVTVTPKPTEKEIKPTKSKVDTEAAKERFIQFWNAYAKKTDSAKCEKIFLNLPEADQLKIIEVVANYVLSTPDIKFRKNPLTWLNGKCWNDEIILTVKKETIKVGNGLELTEKEAKTIFGDENDVS